MTKKNFISGIAWSGFFAYFYFASSALKESAALWPRTVSAIGLVFSLSSVCISALGLIKQNKTQQGGETWLPFHRTQLLRSAAVVVILIIWTLLLKPVGFMTCSVTALCGLFLLFEQTRTTKHILRDLVVAASFGVGIYWLFRLLGVSFPAGLLM